MTTETLSQSDRLELAEEIIRRLEAYGAFTPDLGDIATRANIQAMLEDALRPMYDRLANLAEAIDQLSRRLQRHPGPMDNCVYCEAWRSDVHAANHTGPANGCVECARSRRVAP